MSRPIPPRILAGLTAAVALTALLSPTPAIADPMSPQTGARVTTSGTPTAGPGGHVYFVDATSGSDTNTGLSQTTAWRSLSRITTASLIAGDVVALHRGQTFSGSATISEAGAVGNPITITAYATGGQPILTNPGQLNMLVLDAPYISVKNLSFSNGVAFDNSDGTGITGLKYERSGAVAITDAGTNDVVQDSSFTAVGVGVKTYGYASVVDHNTFHDLTIAFQGVDTGGCNCSTSYGAIGVSVNNSNVQVTWNDFVRCRASAAPYGYDGGAIEIEGFKHDKNNVLLSHNYSRDSSGFLEVTETTSANVSIDHNISDDYGQFIGWDTTNTPSGYEVNNNTVVRRNDVSPLIDQFYYRVPGPTPTAAWAHFTNNIFDSSAYLSFFDFPRDHNLYAKNLKVGASASKMFQFGAGDIAGWPDFTDRTNGDLRLTRTSVALDNGAPVSGQVDIRGTSVPVGLGTDIGAVENPVVPMAASSVTSDGGFESQTAISSTSSPWYSEGVLSYGVDQSAGKSHSGADNGWITSGTATTWGALHQTVSVDPNSIYRITAWVRASSNFSDGYIGARTTGGALLNELKHSSSPNYGRYLVDVSTGTNSSIVLQVGMYGPGANAWEQIDDISVQKLQ